MSNNTQINDLKEKMKGSELMQKAQPYLVKLNELSDQQKMIAGGALVLVLLAFTFLGGSDNSKNVEKLVWEETGALEKNGLMDIELKKLSCSSTTHERAEYEAYKCDTTIKITEGFTGSEVTEKVTMVMDYNPKTNEIVNTYEI